MKKKKMLDIQKSTSLHCFFWRRHQKKTSKKYICIKQKNASKRKLIVITNRERAGRTGERKKGRKEERKGERKEARKEGRKKGRREERKEGRKEGRKERNEERKERKEGRKEAKKKRQGKKSKHCITYENRYCQSALGGGAAPSPIPPSRFIYLPSFLLLHCSTCKHIHAYITRV